MRQDPTVAVLLGRFGGELTRVFYPFFIAG